MDFIDTSDVITVTTPTLASKFDENKVVHVLKALNINLKIPVERCRLKLVVIYQNSSK